MTDAGRSPPIEGILETSLYARDLSSTADFYRDLFGFPTLVDSPRLVAFEVGRRQVLLVFKTGATEADIADERGVIPGHDARGRVHFAMSIAASELDPWRRRLAWRAIKVDEYAWVRGGTSLYFRDPDGALVELATPGLWWPASD